MFGGARGLYVARPILAKLAAWQLRWLRSFASSQASRIAQQAQALYTAIPGAIARTYFHFMLPYPRAPETGGQAIAWVHFFFQKNERNPKGEASSLSLRF